MKVGNNMRKKFLLCVFANCVAYFVLANSNFYADLFKKLQSSFLLDTIPIIVISAIFSFIGKAPIKEKMVYFIKSCIISYVCIVAIVFVCVMYAMGRFD